MRASPHMHFKGLGFAKLPCEISPFGKDFTKGAGDTILRQTAQSSPISCS